MSLKLCLSCKKETTDFSPGRSRCRPCRRESRRALRASGMCARLRDADAAGCVDLGALCSLTALIRPSRAGEPEAA